MTMVAMLCGVAAMAQAENYLYVQDQKVEKGTALVEVPVCMKNTDDVTAVSFRLALSEGLTPGLNKKGKFYVTIDEDRMEDHTSILQVANDGNQMISVYSASVSTFYENDGAIVYVPVAVTDPTVDATYDVKVYNVSISTPAGVSIATATESACKLQVGEGTGINSINAADSKAPVYNLAGQRVSKAQKGVFIQHGKKVAVK